MQNPDDESDDAKTQVHARIRKPVTKRKRSTEVHKLYERVSLYTLTFHEISP